MTDKQLFEAIRYFRELASSGPHLPFNAHETAIRYAHKDNKDKADLLVQLSKLIQKGLDEPLKQDKFAKVRKFLATMGSQPPGSQSENAPE